MQTKLKQIKEQPLSTVASFALLFFLLVMLFSSCKSIHPLLQSKRHEVCLKESVALCNANNQLTIDTTDLSRQLHKIHDEYNDLDDKYKSLSNTSDMNLVQWNEALKSQSKELEKKEKLLQEREQKLKEMQSIFDTQDSLTNQLHAIVKNALFGFNHDELTVEIKNGKVYVSMSEKLLFQAGSSEVKTKGKQALKKLTEVLNKNTDVDILMEGNTITFKLKQHLAKTIGI